MMIKRLSFSDRLRWRNRGLALLLIFMIAYMIFIGEIGWGDSRIMSRLAEDMSRIIYFGGLIWIIWKIVRNNRILKSSMLLKEHLEAEMDERNQYIYDKSGGLMWDILFVILLFSTFTTSLINMPAFYTSYAILICAVILKLILYFWYKTR